MARVNIVLNNKNYSIDESALSAASAALKSHLSTVMNGTGATINLDGTAYGIDATKLTAATNGFITHLGTISGTGKKVTVGGVEYGIGTDKVAGAVSELENHWSDLGEEILEGDGQEFHKFAPTALTFRSTAPLNELQEIQINGVTVDPSNYTLEEGSTVVTLPIEYLKTLDVDNYEITVVSDSKSVSGGFSVKAPELNEHGFYYNQPYTAYVPYYGSKCAFFIREDGTYDFVNINDSYVETGTYEINGSDIMTHSSLGDVPATLVSSEQINCAAIGASFVCGSDTSIAADEDYIYTYKEDLGGYEVTAIDKTKAEYGAIKTGINGIDTVAIGERAFIVDIATENKNLIVAPRIPITVTLICNYAFYQCKNLESVTLPEGLLTIEHSVFFDCDSLKEITIPNGVTRIDDNAFKWCDNLTNITFNGTIEQWNAIEKGEYWYDADYVTYVQCSDGQVAL